MSGRIITKDLMGPITRDVLAELSGNVSKPSAPVETGTKRPYDEGFDIDDCDDLQDVPIDKNCDQVRRMINTMLDNGDMKAVEFQRAINVSSKAYYAFMNQSGAYKGSGCDTYMKGWAFFKHREMQGKPLPKKKTKTAAASKSKGPKMPGSETTDGKDLSNIHLDGEQTDSVPVLDSCDEVRKKISAHLKKDTVVQAALLRDFHAQYHTDRAPKKIQGSQLDRFRNMKGAKSGNTNPIYYSAYCFFEKLRIAEGKPKSNHRQQMEQIYGDEGMDVTERDRGTFWGLAGDTFREDQFGRVSLNGGPPRKISRGLSP